MRVPNYISKLTSTPFVWTRLRVGDVLIFKELIKHRTVLDAQARLLVELTAIKPRRIGDVLFCNVPFISNRDVFYVLVQKNRQVRFFERPSYLFEDEFTRESWKTVQRLSDADATRFKFMVRL